MNTSASGLTLMSSLELQLSPSGSSMIFVVFYFINIHCITWFCAVLSKNTDDETPSAMENCLDFKASKNNATKRVKVQHTLYLKVKIISYCNKRDVHIKISNCKSVDWTKICFFLQKAKKKVHLNFKNILAEYYYNKIHRKSN